MAYKYNKRKQIRIGGTLAAVGCFIRSLQLVLSALSADAANAKWLYVSMLCLLCGGFALTSYEKRGKTSFFAICAAASGLLTSTMGNMSDGSDGLRIASALFLFATFFFGAMTVISSNVKTAFHKIGAVIVVILAVICEIAAFGAPVPMAFTIICLILAYITMGITLIGL